jgi:4-diphosphocytidyl-2-C-methyl-D-erythritol kinase
VSLCPQIAGALVQARDAGATSALVSGSGPTVLGLFARAGGSPDGGLALAQAAAASFAEREPAPIYAAPVDGTFARAVTLGVSKRRLRA